MTMKKKMIVVGCAALVALSGCDGEKKSAESIGIIGGEDGPTATWMTTIRYFMVSHAVSSTASI